MVDLGTLKIAVVCIQLTQTTMVLRYRAIRGGGCRVGGPDDVLERRPELVAAEGPVLERVAAVLLHVDNEHGRRHAEDVGGHGEAALGAPALRALEPYAAGAALGHPHPAPAAGGHLLEPGDDAARRLPRREPQAAVPVAPPGAPLPRSRPTPPPRSACFVFCDLP